MPIPWSRIHAKLGESPGDLTFEHLRAAVAQGMTEEDDLDWKGAVPAKGQGRDPAGEFAKDVAAMANTRGGLLIYGVVETQGTGAAERFNSADTSEGTQRTMRQWAGSRIRPIVVGLGFTPLSGTDDRGNEVSALVVRVPRSHDAPHLLTEDNRFCAPWRDGPETRWMAEPSLERAYSDRFGRRRTEEHRLTDLVADLTERLDFATGAWLLGVAAPRSPLPGILRTIGRVEVRTILEAALGASHDAVPASTNRYSVLKELGQDAVSNPQVGLRRWIAAPRKDLGPDAKSAYVHVELHHDGSICFAATVEPWADAPMEGKRSVVCPLVESFAVDFVALAAASVRHSGDESAIAMRMDLVAPPTSALPFIAVDSRRVGNIMLSGLGWVEGSRSIAALRPVVNDVPVLADAATVRLVARQLAMDVLHQFGVQRLSVLEKEA